MATESTIKPVITAVVLSTAAIPSGGFPYEFPFILD